MPVSIYLPLPICVLHHYSKQRRKNVVGTLANYVPVVQDISKETLLAHYPRRTKLHLSLCPRFLPVEVRDKSKRGERELFVHN